MTEAPTDRLGLPQVTLCAATSVNLEATVRALEASLAEVDFAACKLFTDADIRPKHPGITIVPIPRLASAAAYSNFLLSRMVDHIETSHCLVAQWDGHVLDARSWLPEFLDYDYIGASWPQFDDGHDVGNGGFSLRSRRLMEECRDPRFHSLHPEDIAIGRTNRCWLEGRGMRFAPRAIADYFSAERAGDLASSFGYHGIWHMPSAIGVDAFWNVYSSLDNYATLRRDFAPVLRQVKQARGGYGRALYMIINQLRHVISRPRT